MKQQLVYDYPTRIFHWLFSGLFLTAFIITKTIDDESPIFFYHMLAGFSLSFLVILRLFWGFFGSQHARFSKFALKPTELVGYFRNILTGKKEFWSGHNPASSWAAVIMMLLALGLGLTGFLMTSGDNKEDFEDIHEILANTFMIVVVLHIAGILLHTIRYRELIGLSMINGRKNNVPDKDSISSSHSLIGALLIGLMVAFVIVLIKNYDFQKRSLYFLGTTLQLGENDESENNENNENNENSENSENKTGDLENEKNSPIQIDKKEQEKNQDED